MKMKAGETKLHCPSCSTKFSHSFIMSLSSSISPTAIQAYALLWNSSGCPDTLIVPIKDLIPIFSKDPSTPSSFFVSSSTDLIHYDCFGEYDRGWFLSVSFPFLELTISLVAVAFQAGDAPIDAFR
jgi:hypothetical protein